MPQPLDSATMVRIRLATGERIAGRLLAPFGPDSPALVYAPPEYVNCGVPRARCRFQVARGEVQSLEVQRGFHATRGALVGGAIGAALGLWLSTIGDRVDYSPLDGFGGGGSRGRSTPVLTLFGAAVGAGIGTLVGLGSPRWGPAP